MTDTLTTETRVLPIHGLGHRPTNPADLAGSLAEAGLANWNVRTVPLRAMTDNGIHDLPRHQLIIRDYMGMENPIAPTGSAFTPVQNEELLTFAAGVLDNSDLILDSLGATQQGRKVFITLRSPETVTYGPNETFQSYLLLATGHDGGMSTLVKPMNVRLACTNQLPGLRKRGLAFRIRHTGATIDHKIQQAREVLNVQHTWAGQMDEEIRELLDTSFTRAQFDQITRDLFPLTEDLSKATVTKREAARDDLMDLWQAPTNATAGNTAYRAVQTVTEYAQWVKGSDKTRAERLLWDAEGGWQSTAVSRVLLAV